MAIQTEAAGLAAHESPSSVFGSSISTTLQTLCPNSGDAVEAVFQHSLPQKDKKMIKKALQNAVDLARCGAKITANLRGQDTPFGKTFTKYFGKAYRNQSLVAAAAAVHVNLRKASNVLLDGIAVKTVDSSHKRCQCSKPDTRDLLGSLLPFQCPDEERLGAFVQFEDNVVVKGKHGFPLMNICLQSHEKAEWLGFTVLHEALHVANQSIGDMEIEGIKAYGAERCEALAEKGTPILNADSYVFFIAGCLEKKRELRQSQENEENFRSFFSIVEATSAKNRQKKSRRDL